MLPDPEQDDCMKYQDVIGADEPGVAGLSRGCGLGRGPGRIIAEGCIAGGNRVGTRREVSRENKLRR